MPEACSKQLQSFCLDVLLNLMNKNEIQLKKSVFFFSEFTNFDLLAPSDFDQLEAKMV